METIVAKKNSPLRSRMYNGVSWTILGSASGQVLSLLRTIVLARLLSTGDFGLMGMAVTVVSALAVFTNFDMGGSIIATRFDSEDRLHRHLNTVWTFGIMRGLALCFLLAIASYPTAKFYGDARLGPILMVMALMPLLSSFGNIGLTLASRDVDLGRLTRLGMVSNVLSLLLIIGLAFWTHNVWALVIGSLAGSLIGAVLSYVFHPYRPRLMLDRNELKMAFGFGKWIFVIGVMTYITTTADNILVGKLLGASVLGSYVVAYSIANLPSNLTAQIFTTVLFPSFAELGRGDVERLESALTRVFTIGSALLIIITIPMMLLAPEIIELLYGDKWANAAQPLRILVLIGLFRGLLLLFSPLISGLKRPDIDARSKIVEAILFLSLLYPLTQHYGALGAAWSGVITYAFALVLRYRMAYGFAPGAFVRFPGIVGSVALAGASGAAVGWAVLQMMYHLQWNMVMSRIVMGGLASMLTTTMAIMVFRPILRHEFQEIWHSVRHRAAA